MLLDLRRDGVPLRQLRRECQQLVDERLVLGALVRGTAGAADVLDIEWTELHHARIADVLLSALELHGTGAAVTPPGEAAEALAAEEVFWVVGSFG